MNTPGLRRFGSASAPRFRVGRASKVMFAVVLVLVVLTAIVVTKRWVDTRDTPHILGTVIGISLALALVAIAAASWIVYWAPLKRATKEVSGSRAASIVISGRLPKLADTAGPHFWPAEAGSGPPPQDVVLAFSIVGLTVFSTERPERRLWELPWLDIREVIVAEYVEGDRAYEGLAVIGRSADSALIFQVVDVSLPIARFPRGSRLTGIADAIRGLKPS